MSKGDKRGAYEHYQKCVDVTPKMAFNLIKALQMINVQYIVSPYEADAQLAYLARNNMVDAVITEDSDLIPYGASRVSPIASYIYYISILTLGHYVRLYSNSISSVMAKN